jgi:hypothetical protein
MSTTPVFIHREPPQSPYVTASVPRHCLKLGYQLPFRMGFKLVGVGVFLSEVSILLI